LNEFPILKQEYDQLLEVLRANRLEPTFEIHHNLKFPDFPSITLNDWPSYEDGVKMEGYYNAVIAVFAELELWLCEQRTYLVLYVDELIELKKLKDLLLKDAIEHQIELHKKHREQDRNEAIYDLEIRIKHAGKLMLKKYNDRLAEIKSYSTEQLIRDRSLTDYPKP
jgi:hypothetical protein